MGDAGGRTCFDESEFRRRRFLITSHPWDFITWQPNPRDGGCEQSWAVLLLQLRRGFLRSSVGCRWEWACCLYTYLIKVKNSFYIVSFKIFQMMWYQFEFILTRCAVVNWRLYFSHLCRCLVGSFLLDWLHMYTILLFAISNDSHIFQLFIQFFTWEKKAQ